MSHPRRKDLFVRWSKAMVDGATVDKPNYSPAGAPGSKRATRGPKRRKSHKRVTTTRKKREKKNG